jgi:tripartite-type tricarboxylate transporter receptor subunit TctC
MKDEFDCNGLAAGSATRRDFLKISGFSVGALALGPIINAPFAYGKDLYPATKIQYIVPNKPGGGYDIIARAMGPYMTKYLQKLTPGAKGGGIVVRNEERKGYPILYNAKPDGYTIGIMDTTPYIDNLLGEMEVDFTKYTFLQVAVSTTKVIVANKKSFNNWNEAVNAQTKGTVKMGVGFFARSNHVCGIIANEKLGTKFKLIPFRGTAESMGALMRGDVEIAMVSEDSAKALIDAKEIKVLLSFSDHTDYPGAVNIKELGHPEMIDEISSHRIQIAPPKLAAEPRRLIIEAMKKACDDPDFIAWAKTANYPVKRIFGDDAQKFFMKFVKFYNDMAPTLKKYLS